MDPPVIDGRTQEERELEEAIRASMTEAAAFSSQDPDADDLERAIRLSMEDMKDDKFQVSDIGEDSSDSNDDDDTLPPLVPLDDTLPPLVPIEPQQESMPMA